jgi:pyrimidine-nucleoside phosphorylase
MRAVDLIEVKRDGGELTMEQIDWFIRQVTDDAIPDYQVAALLMAIYLRGMSTRETVDITLAMARSGLQLDLHDGAEGARPFFVDKHSSGGIGDKTSLVIVPLVAACELPVAKMSGRGLGSGGGTLDKMESFRGWSGEMSVQRFKKQLAEIGIVLAGQSADLAPADGKLYALRDVTATVDHTALIAASIMSKKLATGSDAIVLDVKVGSGAFMPTLEAGRELAQMMVDIGSSAGRKMTALLADMNQPLGHAIGNALEVREAIETLRGGGPDDFWQHCLEVASHMLLAADKAESLEAAKAQLQEARRSGRAFEKFRAMVVAQGGDGAQVDDPANLPQASVVTDLRSPRSGYLAAMDAAAIGWATVHLGAGRQVKGEAIDHAVGLVMPVKVGQRIEAGDLIAEIHAQDDAQAEQCGREVLDALSWSEEAVEPLPHFYEVIVEG